MVIKFHESTFFQTINGVRRIVSDLFLVFPNYCLGNGLMEIALNHYKNEFYSHTGKPLLILFTVIFNLGYSKRPMAVFSTAQY